MELSTEHSVTPEISIRRILIQPHTVVPGVILEAEKNQRGNMQGPHLIPHTPSRVATLNRLQPQKRLQYTLPTVGPHLISPDDERTYNLRLIPLPQSNKYALASNIIVTYEENEVIHQATG